MNGERIGLARLVAAAAIAGSLLAAAAAPAPRAARIEKHRPAAGEPLGTLFFSQDFDGNGLFTLSMVDGTAVNIGVSGVAGSNVGLAPSEDEAVLFGSEPSRLLRINADGSGTMQFDDSIRENGLAYDAEAGILYGAEGTIFRTVNPADGSASRRCHRKWLATDFPRDRELARYCRRTDRVNMASHTRRRSD